MGHGWFIKIKRIDARWNCFETGLTFLFSFFSFFCCFLYLFLSLLLYTFNASQYKVPFEPVKGPCLATELTGLHFICLCGLFFLFWMHVFFGSPPCRERVPCPAALRCTSCSKTGAALPQSFLWVSARYKKLRGCCVWGHWCPHGVQLLLPV